MAIQQAFMVLGIVPPNYETYETPGTYSVNVPPGITEVSCLLYTSPSPRDGLLSRMPSSA